MKRRAFITLLCGAAAAWPLAARAQQAERVRRIGVLMGIAEDREGQARVTVLKQRLQELGWADGRNIQIETRFSGGDTGHIRAHAAELVALAPDVIVGQTTPVIRALRQATSSIPIVMPAVNDPVEQGLVSSLAHPGGNITGFMFIDFQMVGKWLEATATFSFETGHTTFKSINWGRADEQLSSGLDYRKDDITRVAQQLLSKLPR